MIESQDMKSDRLDVRGLNECLKGLGSEDYQGPANRRVGGEGACGSGGPGN